MTPSEWHQFVLSTPDPVQWDCFRFGIIQRADHFTFFSIVDHLHCDPTIISGLYTEIVMNYRVLVTGGALVQLPPPASHDDFCMREKQHVSALTLDSPEVRKWIEFAENNGGTLPDFPLPLGDLSVASGGDLMVERLMDQEQTAEFESLCVEAGARFSGGLFACVALAQYELTGAKTYYGLTPIDKRRSLAEFSTMGWFTGVVPFTVPVNPTSFARDCPCRAGFLRFESRPRECVVQRRIEVGALAQGMGTELHHGQLHGYGPSSLFRYRHLPHEGRECESLLRPQGSGAPLYLGDSSVR